MKIEIDNDIILRQFMSREYAPGDILSQLEFIITVPGLLGKRVAPDKNCVIPKVFDKFLPLPIEKYTGRVPEDKVLPYVTSVVYNALVSIDNRDTNTVYNTKEFLKLLANAKKEAVELLNATLPDFPRSKYITANIERQFNELISFAKTKDIANTMGHRKIDNDLFIDNDAIMFDCIHGTFTNNRMYVDLEHPTASLTMKCYDDIFDNRNEDIFAYFLANCVFIIGAELYSFRTKYGVNQRYFLLSKLRGEYYTQGKNMAVIDWSFNQHSLLFMIASMLMYNKLLYGDSFIADMDKKLVEMRKEHIALITGQSYTPNARSVLEMAIPSEDYESAYVKEAMESVYTDVNLGDMQNDSVDRMCNKAIDAIIDACSKINSEV